MTEYLIAHASFAAPFMSDTGETFVEAETPQEALQRFRAKYTHPAGLYAATCYASADDFMKGRQPLAKWLCNHELKMIEATKGKTSYSFLGKEPGVFVIDDVTYRVSDPKDGRIVTGETA